MLLVLILLPLLMLAVSVIKWGVKMRLGGEQLNLIGIEPWVRILGKANPCWPAFPDTRPINRNRNE